MPANFLQQLTQSGALNVANPARSYANALQMKHAQTQIKGAELDNEGKVIEIGKAYLSRVQDLDDYNKYTDYMVNKLGANPDLFPKLNSEEELQAALPAMLLTAKEMADLKKGNRVDIVDLKTGDSLGKVSQEDIIKMKANGTWDQLKLGTTGSYEYKKVTEKFKAQGAVEGGPPKETPAEKRAADLAKQKELATFTAGLKPAQAEPIYGKEKMIDDTRGYYTVKQRVLLDEQGYVKPGMEDEYKRISEAMDKDMQLINAGEKPSWLTGKDALPEGVTEADIEFTMKKHNMTRAQVLDAIRNK